MVTSDFRLEVEIRQFCTCALKNDSVGHSGLSSAMGQIPHSTERISSFVFFLLCYHVDGIPVNISPHAKHFVISYLPSVVQINGWLSCLAADRIDILVVNMAVFIFVCIFLFMLNL